MDNGVEDMSGRHDALARVAERIPSMLAYWDHDLRCRYANRAYETWFGVDPEALLGRHIRDLLGPTLYEKNRPYILAALAGEPQLFERTVPGPDGVNRQSLACYVPDIVEGRVLGFAVDVTDVTPIKASSLTGTAPAWVAELSESVRTSLNCIGGALHMVDRTDDPLLLQQWLSRVRGSAQDILAALTKMEDRFVSPSPEPPP